MLKRKAIASIKNWVNTKNKKCLVVQGARQTGKTYIIERFAEDNYEELLEINFKQMVSAVDIFSGDLTVDNMVMAMRFRFPEKKILPGKTLIFLDEIQECQEAITSLKFWAIDNRYDVIVSGSLLGIDYKRASSYPVGYVDYLRMYGIDFEEFLWGMGISEDMIGNLCGYLESKTVIPEAIHSQMMNYYRQYIAIGGMPEAVQKYVDTNGNGRLDAVSNTLKQFFDISYELSTYEEHALSHGSSSKAIAYVGITCDGKNNWGVGMDEDIIKASISALVVAVNKLPQIQQNEEGQDERLTAMLNYIQNNYQTVTLESVAEQFHLSEPYVSKYIKDKSGKTFGEHVAHIRMKRAKTLLKNGNMTVENIAYAIGYQNVEHFNRTFKKSFDMTPIQYRNESREQK